ncbi:hypothetical protein [Winogradskyella flava]|uniref:Uncharacterized protein n=3 Tax=Winogradskyella flava TaxID=1884876 RepID=A0A842IQ29_9FLAO|nr:hypothetical protein [Winogradskyella flava]MBC2844805.1 hypothetical protein [Winogradskyella flava]
MFYKKTVGIKNTIYNELAQLQAQEVTENDVRRFGYRVNDLVFSLNEDLDNFEKMTFVKLPNIDEVNDLKEAIIDGGAFKKQSGNIFENGGFNVLLTDVENAIVHCQRLDQKSLSVILDFHKKLHERLN